MPLSKIQITDNQVVPNLGRRRLNPNGAMLVSQRATTKATLTDGYNCLDRVRTYKSHDGVVEESQSTDTPNSEFYNSLKHRVTTADTSIAAGQYHALNFRLEGNSVTQLGFGTSGAKKVTVSFWVKSSVAGAYGTCLRNLASNRFNMQTMTINSADTWEKKSITYTGDTGGTWPKDNTEGLQFQLSQAMGTTYQGTSADAWVTTVDVAPSNQVNWLATVGNTFYLTGLQIEEGSVATEFEHRSFAEELYLCKRYYQKSFNYETAPENGGNTSSFSYNGGLLGYCGSNNNGTLSGFHRFDPEMKSLPVVTTYGNSNGHWGRLIPTNTGTTSFSAGSGYISVTKQTGINFGQNVSGDTLIIGFGHITADAEL